MDNLYIVIFHFPYYKNGPEEFQKSVYYGKNEEEVHNKVLKIIENRNKEKGSFIWKEVSIFNIISGIEAKKLVEKNVIGMVDCTEDGITINFT